MQKIKTTLLISFLLFGLFFVFTPSAKAEIIRNFDSYITVLPDASILVKEKISYDFQDEIRHGIFRSIPLYNFKKEPVEIKIISVADENDKKYEFTESNSDKILTIKIGDPDQMISGEKEYNITYQVFGSIGYYDDFDEIYWNVTGNNWQVPIEKASATVTLPNNVFSINQFCYYGEIGSNTNCKITESNTFITENVLRGKEGLTIAVDFPKGIVAVYYPKIESALIKSIKTYWPLVVPLVVLIFMYIRWFKKGRDPIGKDVIIPQYDVLDGLTPLEVGGIINGKVENQNISAEIIYLATKGYLKIKKIDKDCNNFLCLVSEDDYEFTLLKEEGLLANDYDRKIINTIFEGNGEVGGKVLLSGLNDRFYKTIKSIDDSVVDSLLKKKYYTNFPKNEINNSIMIPIFLAMFFVFEILQKDKDFFDIKKFIIVVSSFVLLVIIVRIFNHLMPAKSIKGVLAKEHLLGLKEYLKIAEKDRLNFHNMPDKKPEIFEKLLPYAMVFGVEELWAKEFESIYLTSPTWYEGSTKFNVYSFGHDMTAFSLISTTSMSSSPNSGSGGSSGGGGGGGGGGSW